MTSLRASGRGRDGRAAAGTAALDPGDAEAAHEAALRLLDRSRRTRLELGRKLVDRGFSRAVVTSVLDRLEGVGLVDDVEYARAYLAGRWGRGPTAWRQLTRVLRGRGIAMEDVEAARARLVEEVGEIDERRAAQKVLAVAARRYQGLDRHVRRRRLYGLLARRGFDAETIEAVLKDEA